VVAEAKANKNSGKNLTPEEAALISLPSTKIDLGFDLGPEFITAEQKAREVRKIQPEGKHGGRKLASVDSSAKKARAKSVPAEKPSETGDSEVDQVLVRLRSLAGRDSPAARVPASGRGPASVGAKVIADPVYDYSQNF
jgi:hypothetical protein